jgi:myo-inositol-1(or 4)-monophosphatase
MTDSPNTAPEHPESPEQELLEQQIERRLELAREAAIAAGELVVASFRGRFATSIKERNSAVTNVDHEAEELLRQHIRRRFPRDSIIGEEGGLDSIDDTWCWTLDPIDGTQNFVAGIPLFAIAVGVLHRLQPVVGIIHDPLRDETYAARRGRGAWLGGAPLRVPTGPLGAQSLFAVRHRFLRGERVGFIDSLPTSKWRTLGSVCLELAYVAAGALGGLLAGSVRLWEVVPGVLLIEEAGGGGVGTDGRRVFPLDGDLAAAAARRLKILCGSPAVIEQVAAELDKLPL